MACRVHTMPLSSMRKLGGDIFSKGDGGGSSHESDHDLAMLVSDFLEGSSGAESPVYSSDSDSALSDLRLLLGKITYIKLVTDQSESDLMSVVYTRVLSIREGELQGPKSGPCDASCIRFLLVKLLKRSGYDARVCVSKSETTSSELPKVTCKAEHEYIDVVLSDEVGGGPERFIIDVDFRSHFEIARAVDNYTRLLNRLPVIFVGSQTKLEQYLQLMAEAARCSYRENSMALPPWRSFEYLQAKWRSPAWRRSDPGESNREGAVPVEHKGCAGYFRELRSLLVSEIESERKLWPFMRSKIVKAERRKCATC